MFDFAGRIALVTGAARGGLGHYSALTLAAQGARVIASDAPSREADLDATVQAVRAAGGAAERAMWDVTSKDDVDRAVNDIAERHGRLDVLVHHAGVMLRAPSFETSLEDWHRVIDVNLTGSWLVARAAARTMVENGYGRIVLTSSIYASIVGPLPEPAYYASKAGVANLTRGLASEWGPSGVTVNCLAPGVFFPTQMTRSLEQDPGRLKEMERRTFVGRLGNPETDLAGALIWLASEESRYVTGQVIYVDGGWTAW